MVRQKNETCSFFRGTTAIINISGKIARTVDYDILVAFEEAVSVTILDGHHDLN